MGQDKSIVKFAVPKGSLQKTTAAFFEKAGIPLEGYGEGSRDYRPKIGLEGVEVKVLRPQEIPILVSRGHYDIGISGLDWYYESRCEKNVEDIAELGFGKVHIVLAVPDAWEDVNSADDLFKKYRSLASTRTLRIWTEYLNLADQFVFKYEGTEATIVSPYAGIHRERHSGIEIFHSFGATESKPPEDGDAIIDNTETGRTLRANGLKIIHKVLASSTAQLLANRRSLLDKEKSAKIEQIRAACQKAAGTSQERRRTGYGHLDW
jgi:ATP phosphoribosyltransferase